MRQLSEKDLAYERLGDANFAALSHYDTSRRVTVLVDEFLADVPLRGKVALEHTPDPRNAIRQLVGACRPGGWVVLSTPNVVWQAVVRTATRFGMRPFNGYENFLSWSAIRSVLRDAGAAPVRQQGLHLFLFQLGLHTLSRRCDDHLQFLRGLMINVCVLARRS